MVALLWVALIGAITFNGGLRAGVGFFSILDALRLANAKVATINVDKGSFQTLIFGLVGICAVGFGIVLRTKPTPLALSIVGLVTIVAGTFIDTQLSPKAIAMLMTSKNYQRCPEGDHQVHSYIVDAYFANYVANSALCHPFTKNI